MTSHRLIWARLFIFFRQIFEKALDEPKYSSMYAQLCKRLAENAPNFDPIDKPCTFKRLLLNKCKDEFENRYFQGKVVWAEFSTLKWRDTTCRVDNLDHGCKFTCSFLR